MQQTSYFLSIADFTLELRNQSSSILKLDEGFTSFFATESNALQPDVILNCYDAIPSELTKTAKSLYAAKNETELLWEIFEHSEGLQIMVYNPENTSELQQVALYNEQEQIWNIYTNKVADIPDSCFYPMQYPLAPLILYYLTLNHDAILIHASGIFDGEKGRIFSGFSGVGKSTMAGLWNKAGSSVINDDRLILRKLDGQYWLYNTPMYYVDENKKAPLHHIYLPFHNAENTYEKLSGVRAIAELMAFCIQHGYREKNTSGLFQSILDLSQEVSIAKIGVVPTLEIIDFIKSREENVVQN